MAKARGAARQTISDKKDWGAGPKRKKAASMKIRDALLYRQTLATLIERSVRSSRTLGRTSADGRMQGIADMPGPTYLTAAAPPSKLPPRVFCSVCGYWGKYRCMKCAMPYCSLDCQATHNDTRCEKRVV
jgi:zinc finger HIT domain-containing protein 1